VSTPGQRRRGVVEKAANTGVKLRSSNTLGFVSFNSLLGGPAARLALRPWRQHRLASSGGLLRMLLPQTLRTETEPQTNQEELHEGR
jgi:hypothetical protein